MFNPGRLLVPGQAWLDLTAEAGSGSADLWKIVIFGLTSCVLKLRIAVIGH
jgi:hypothetical protein